MYVFLCGRLEIQGVETAWLRDAYNLDYYDHTCTSFVGSIFITGTIMYYTGVHVHVHVLS